MQIRTDTERPIFMQICEGIEDAILIGAYAEESQIPSITEFSTTYKINPATALKGINMLVDTGIVYKKRGLGMFVSTGAVENLRLKRCEQFYENYISALIEEASRLGINISEIVEMIEKGFKNERD